MASVTDYFVESAGREGLAIGIIPGNSTARGGRLGASNQRLGLPQLLRRACGLHSPTRRRPRGRTKQKPHQYSLGGPCGRVAGRHGNACRDPACKTVWQGGAPVPRRHGYHSCGSPSRASGKKVLRSFGTCRSLIAAGNLLLDPERVNLAAGAHRSSEKCVLRSWRWTDAEPVQRHANSRQVWRNLLDGFPSPYTVRDARRWLIHALAMSPETAFAIESDGEAVGGIGFVFKEGSSSSVPRKWGTGWAKNFGDAASRPTPCGRSARLRSRIIPSCAACMPTRSNGITHRCAFSRKPVTRANV